MSTKPKRSSFRVGDRVRINSGPQKYTGVIVQDLGPLGLKGRHLFQVDIPIDPDEPMNWVRREDEMEAIPPGEEVPRPLDKHKIIEYLVYGGLISILRSNQPAGKYQPLAWLCRDQLGNVTHTFVQERGMVGGQVVPSGAVFNSKVFAPKRDAVLSFVESFGLNRQEAEKVVSEVGTAP